jgi:succinate dehydrogenase/fumarate reductase cytochrome b subunit
MNAKKLHFYSGITISIFVFLHLFNHFMVLTSAEKHLEIMDSLRLIYRNLVAESILLIAVVIQVISGIIQFRKMKNTKGFERLQVVSGLYLAFFFVIHVSAVMAGRTMGTDTNLYFAIGGLYVFPAKLFFIPYYSLSIIAFFSHLAGIHYKKSQAYFTEKQANLQAKILVVLGIISSVLIMFGMMTVGMPNQ